MRRAARIDDNQTEIVKALRKHGISVMVTSGLGNGFMDIVAGGIHRATKERITELMEIKDSNKPPSQRKLTPKEKKVHDEWKGRPIRIVESVADALAIFGIKE